MTVTESDYERILDARISGRLLREPSYLNAENSEEQSAAEQRIEETEALYLNAEMLARSDLTEDLRARIEFDDELREDR